MANILAANVEGREPQAKVPIPVPVQDTPTSYPSAMRRPDAAQWKLAFKDEMDSHHANTTFRVETPPAGSSILPMSWVLDIKSDGRKKARMVVGGHRQQHGRDWFESFAPVAKFSSIRAGIALATQNKWSTHHMDVKTAYLYGKLDEVIYARLPPGALSEQGGEVVRVLKAIYGLKQAGRIWYRTLSQLFMDKGLTRLNTDECIFTLRRGKEVVIIMVYVDDLTIISSCDSLRDEVKSFLNSRFLMKDLGPTQRLLGIEFAGTTASGTITIHQREYTHTILARFGLQTVRPEPTPMVGGQKLLPFEEGDERADVGLYQSMLGSAMYLMVGTRPDLAFALSVLSRFAAAPTATHMRAMHRLFAYLAGTPDYGIQYRSFGDTDGLVGFGDADWGGELPSHRSTSGVVFCSAGGAISYMSKRQRVTAFTVPEAEWFACGEAVREGLWMRNLRRELQLNDGHTPIPIFTDNKAALALTQNLVQHARSKQLDVVGHAIRDHVRERHVSVEHVRTSMNAADILTKPLGPQEFLPKRKLLGIRRIPSTA